MKPNSGNEPILDIRRLNISYYTRKGEVPAVVDFNFNAGARRNRRHRRRIRLRQIHRGDGDYAASRQKRRHRRRLH